MPVSAIEVSVNGVLLSDLDRAGDALTGDVERQLFGSSPEIQAVLREFMDRVSRRLTEMHSTPWRPERGGHPYLFKRSGAGLRDILTSILYQGNGLNYSAGIALTGYMAVQETGATITPKRSKYLTIPLPAALNANGIPLKRRARDWDNTFVARSRKGNLLIFRRQGREITPLYVLKSSVRIPPRLALEETFNSELPYFERRMFETIDRIMGA